jgi:hypothetical protein
MSVETTHINDENQKPITLHRTLSRSITTAQHIIIIIASFYVLSIIYSYVCTAYYSLRKKNRITSYFLCSLKFEKKSLRPNKHSSSNLLIDRNFEYYFFNHVLPLPRALLIFKFIQKKIIHLEQSYNFYNIYSSNIIHILYHVYYYTSIHILL